VALISNDVVTYRFTDSDGDPGEWDFTARLTNGVTRLLNQKYEDAELKAYGLLAERTVAVRGKAWKLTKPLELSNGETYKTGTLMPMADPALRMELLDLLDSVITVGALRFLNGGDVRSAEEQEQFRSGVESLPGSAAGEAENTGGPGAPAEAVGADVAGGATSS
jgi:hypothetical protein